MTTTPRGPITRPAAGRARDRASQAGRRRWPLLAIGASAGTATWSGWVGLGQLTGFGVVHPLPGIADGFTINTAVTLPIGVEAYAMYALSIATSARQLPKKVRRYAWASSAAALLLGMAGQVAYHVMTAGHPIPPPGSMAVQLAPWQVIALVSCLPVLVLGAASLLWHYAGATTEPDQVASDPAISQATATEPDEEPAGPPADPLRSARPDDLARLRDAIVASHAADRPATPGTTQPVAGPVVAAAGVARPDVAAVAGPDAVAATPPLPSHRPVTLLPLHPRGISPAQPPASLRRPGHGRSEGRPARADDLTRLRAEIAAGRLPDQPTVRDVAKQLAISFAHAAAARRAMTGHNPQPKIGQPNSPAPHYPAPEHQPEETPEAPDQESNPPVSKKASH